MDAFDGVTVAKAGFNLVMTARDPSTRVRDKFLLRQKVFPMVRFKRGFGDSFPTVEINCTRYWCGACIDFNLRNPFAAGRVIGVIDDVRCRICSVR